MYLPTLSVSRAARKPLRNIRPSLRRPSRVAVEQLVVEEDARHETQV